MGAAARRVASVPRPLVLLLCAVALVGAAWALLVPPGQAPDEPAHVGYAQVVAEDLRLPDESSGHTFSREQSTAQVYANVDQTAQQVLTRPEWSERVYRAWERADDRLPESARGEGGHADAFRGPNPARANPPLYYLYESAAYHAAGGDFFDRLYAMRLWSVLLLLVATAATWLFVGELTGGRRPLQLAGAAIVGLQPMAVFVSSSVNPDAALIACFALAFWLGVRVLRRGLTLRDGVALGAVAALAVLTKGTGYALVPGVALVLGLGAWRQGRTAAVVAGASALALAVPVLAWLAVARSLDRAAVNKVPGTGGGGASVAGIPDFGRIDYLWQFYLPKLPFLNNVPAIERLPAFDVWIKTGWGAFGWLEVRFPEAAYVVLAIATAAILAGGLVALARRRDKDDLAVAAFLGLVALALLAGLHWIEFRTLRTEGARFNQGRYLLPLLPILAAGAAATLSLVPARWRMQATGFLIGGAVVLQAFSLALVAGRFYA
jgi:4-amino-4-deoxy-L-arabinose transferase-like glycosyltransferase